MNAFLGAAVELCNRIVDYNDGDEVGFGPVQVQSRRGKRHSAAKAFLLPFRHRRNLHILTKARVIKINIDPDTKTAKSVTYIQDRKQHTDLVKAAFEALGGTVDFWQVAMRPGKPFVFGKLGGKFLFGLPGNPVSAFVTFLVLVRPAILRMQGARDLSLPSHPAVLAEPSQSRRAAALPAGTCG